ncbi:anti-sigma factor family protein [Desulfofundulus sp.]|uniref:anti-sigma factor family protein n=1 Tax=Desulfofundulus sp. TaxID=2282750 RepID=UPI003C782697
MRDKKVNAVKCREARKLFYPWLDGELENEEVRRLQEHLRECTACTGGLAEWQAITLALKGVSGQVAPPEGFSAMVMSRLKDSLSARELHSLSEAAGAAVAVSPDAAGDREGAWPRGATAGARAPFSWWRRLSGTWRRGVAAAAAVVMLLAGSAGFAARYWWPVTVGKGSTAIVDNSGQNGQDRPKDEIAANAIEPRAGGPADASNGSRDVQPPGGQENLPGKVADRSDRAGKKIAPPSGSAAHGIQKSGVGQARQSSRQGVAIATNTSGGATEPRVFLNQTRISTSAVRHGRLG